MLFFKHRKRIGFKHRESASGPESDWIFENIVLQLENPKPLNAEEQRTQRSTAYAPSDSPWVTGFGRTLKGSSVGHSAPTETIFRRDRSEAVGRRNDCALTIEFFALVRFRGFQNAIK